MTIPLAKDRKSPALTISVNDLSKRFNREWIFKNFTYQFEPSGTYAITGPNGSGKSTLLQVLWGQLPQSAGIIRYEKDHVEIPIDECFQHLSIATPYMDLIEEFTLSEMIDFHFQLKKLRPGVTKDDLIKIINLENALGKQLIHFSSGMKQRLKLALALYTDAGVYFLDEPATNLDSKAFEWYARELSRLPNDPIVFIASNNSAEYPEKSTILNILDYKK